MRKFSRGFAMIQVMIVTVFAATFVYLSMLHEINKNTKTYHEEAIVTLFPVAYSFVEYAITQIPDNSESKNYYKTSSNGTIENLDDSYYQELYKDLGFDAQKMMVSGSDSQITFTWSAIDGKTPQRVTVIAKGLAEKLGSTLKAQGYTYDATIVTKSNDTYTIEITLNKT